LVKSKWLRKGGLKGGKPTQRVSPLYVFLVLFLHKKRTDKEDKGWVVEVGFKRNKKTQLKINTDIIPIK